MSYWEYKVINTLATGVPLGEGKHYAAQLESGLNELGRSGWELCSIVGGTTMIFKRLTRGRVPVSR